MAIHRHPASRSSTRRMVLAAGASLLVLLLVRAIDPCSASSFGDRRMERLDQLQRQRQNERQQVNHGPRAVPRRRTLKKAKGIVTWQLNHQHQEYKTQSPAPTITSNSGLVDASINRDIIYTSRANPKSTESGEGGNSIVSSIPVSYTTKSAKSGGDTESIIDGGDPSAILNTLPSSPPSHEPGTTGIEDFRTGSIVDTTGTATNTNEVLGVDGDGSVITGTQPQEPVPSTTATTVTTITNDNVIAGVDESGTAITNSPPPPEVQSGTENSTIEDAEGTLNPTAPDAWFDRYYRNHPNSWNIQFPAEQEEQLQAYGRMEETQHYEETHLGPTQVEKNDAEDLTFPEASGRSSDAREDGDEEEDESKDKSKGRSKKDKHEDGDEETITATSDDEKDDRSKGKGLRTEELSETNGKSRRKKDKGDDDEDSEDEDMPAIEQANKGKNEKYPYDKDVLRRDPWKEGRGGDNDNDKEGNSKKIDRDDYEDNVDASDEKDFAEKKSNDKKNDKDDGEEIFSGPRHYPRIKGIPKEDVNDDEDDEDAETEKSRDKSKSKNDDDAKSGKDLDLDVVSAFDIDYGAIDGISIDRERDIDLAKVDKGDDRDENEEEDNRSDDGDNGTAVDNMIVHTHQGGNYGTVRDPYPPRGKDSSISNDSYDTIDSITVDEVVEGGAAEGLSWSEDDGSSNKSKDKRVSNDNNSDDFDLPTSDGKISRGKDRFKKDKGDDGPGDGFGGIIPALASEDNDVSKQDQGDELIISLPDEGSDENPEKGSRNKDIPTESKDDKEYDDEPDETKNKSRRKYRSKNNDGPGDDIDNDSLDDPTLSNYFGGGLRQGSTTSKPSKESRSSTGSSTDADGDMQIELPTDKDSSDSSSSSSKNAGSSKHIRGSKDNIFDHESKARINETVAKEEHSVLGDSSSTRNLKEGDLSQRSLKRSKSKKASKSSKSSKKSSKSDKSASKKDPKSSKSDEVPPKKESKSSESSNSDKSPPKIESKSDKSLPEKDSEISKSDESDKESESSKSDKSPPKKDSKSSKSSKDSKSSKSSKSDEESKSSKSDKGPPKKDPKSSKSSKDSKSSKSIKSKSLSSKSSKSSDGIVLGGSDQESVASQMAYPKKGDKPEPGLKDIDPLKKEPESRIESLLFSWKTLLGLAATFVASSLAIHWLCMKRTRNDARTGNASSGAYKPIGTGGEAEMTEMGSVDDVDAEYGEAHFAQ